MTADHQAAADAAGEPWRLYDQWEAQHAYRRGTRSGATISDFRPAAGGTITITIEFNQGVLIMSSFIMSDEPEIVRAAFGKHDRPGTTVTGVVLELEEAQQTDPKGKKKYMRDGSPLMELRVTIDTELQDDADDDGRRLLYVKGNLRKAFRAAIIAAGDDDLRHGATVTVTYTGLGKAANADYNPPRLYTTVYQPPAAEGAA